MKNIRWTILAALLLTVPTIAHAQQGRPNGGGDVGGPSVATAGGAAGGAAGGTTSAADSGSISNSGGSTTDSSMTSTTTTTSPGMDTMSADGSMADGTGTTALANTGGEPLLMSLVGMSLAGGAFFLRRRVLS